jgi:translocation and assembly module TamB
LSGELRLVGPLANLSLAGRLGLQHSVYRREINLQKLVMEQIHAPERARATEGGPMVLNLTVDAPGTLEVDTPLAKVTLTGGIRVVGTTARFGVLGRLEALPGGELELAGVRYDLDRCVISFQNPERMEPQLDIQAHTTVQNFEISVGLRGTLDRMTPTFTSNPPLPEMDIISLLSVGRKADEAASGQAGAVASSFFTDQITGAVTQRARTLLDVDQLRVDPFAATQSGSPTARLTVVKQLTRSWAVTVSTNLYSNREEIVYSRWQLGQGLYLEASRDADGTYGLEVKWQHRY